MLIFQWCREKSLFVTDSEFESLEISGMVRLNVTFVQRVFIFSFIQNI